MIVAGKCSPDQDQLSRAVSDGFDNVELYLTKAHLDDFEETVAACQSSSVSIVSVHTPHVPLTEAEYLQLANDLADSLDARLVVHSGYILNKHIPDIETNVDFTVPYGYENQPDSGRQVLDTFIFNADHGFVLDTAHLYIGVNDYLTALEDILTTHGDDIEVLHFCDSTRQQDGLAIGEGTMDIATVGHLVKEHYDGIVVLEVMPDAQATAREKFASF